MCFFLFLNKRPLGNLLQGTFGCGNNSQLQKAVLGQETKKQRNKRTQRTGEKAAPRSKKRKKEEEEKQALYPNTDTFMQLKQVSIVLVVWMTVHHRDLLAKQSQTKLLNQKRAHVHHHCCSIRVEFSF